MKFSFIDRAKTEFPVQRLCDVMEVSQSGYFSWKSRPACRRQRDHMVLLARVRSAFALSNGTYGSPRMVQELRDNGLAVKRHAIGGPDCVPFDIRGFRRPIGMPTLHQIKMLAFPQQGFPCFHAGDAGSSN